MNRLRPGSRRLLCAITLAVAGAGSACASGVQGGGGRDGGGGDGGVTGVRDVVERTVQRADALGAVVAVVAGDSVALLESFTGPGASSLPSIDTASLFPAGPAMPIINALAALQASHGDGIDLDLPVGSYVRSMPEAFAPVTLAQLLTHRAGLVAHPARAGQVGHDLDAAPRQLGSYDRLAPPGAIHSRAPAGIALAGWILQEVDGRPYPQLIEASVLEPLGMARSIIGFPGGADIVQGYAETRTAAARYAAIDVEPDSALGEPVHGLYATAADLATMARALLNDGRVDGEQRIPAGTIGEMFVPRGPVPGRDGGDVALAGEVREWEGRRRLTLSGSTAAHAMSFTLLPDDGIGVVVLSNTPNGAGAAIPEAVLRYTLGLDASATRRSGARGGAAADAVAPAGDLPGVYANGGEVLELVDAGSTLRLRSGSLELDVRASGALHQAVLPDGRTALTFEIVHDDDGRAYIWLGDRALIREAADVDE